MVAMDEGAAMLGELALVPVESPISQQGILYYNTLFDENAACHVALGRGFNEVVPGFETMSGEELKAKGINDSIIHVDFMIGCRELSITGVTRDGREVPIFRNGTWPCKWNITRIEGVDYPMKSYSDSYKAAGVDVTAGYESVELMKEHVKRTVIPGVVSGIGGSAGLFAPDLSGMEEPVLVSGTDGVGTKLKIAMLLDKHDTIGIDAVAMCVNDVVCCGARPLFFLDYIACGKNFPEKIAQIVAGVAEAASSPAAPSSAARPPSIPA